MKQVPATPAVDEDTFWLSAASYLLPAHYPVTAWVTHTPFAAWLIDVLRPAAVAELGTHFGCSCFAFAEAARRTGVDTEIFAVDTWEGDDHAGFYGEEVLSYVRSVVEADYPSVKLTRGLFSETRPLFADGSVDLLHIDGRHGYEDVREDYTLWRSAVRDGGVILFHDIAEHDNGFGVWRLWEELAEPGRSFSFEHGHGLGVLAVGSVHPPALAALFSADQETAVRIRRDYAALGQRADRQGWLESLPRELEQVRADVRARADHVAQLEGALEDSRSHLAALDSHARGLGSRLDAMERSSSWRVTSPLRAVGRIIPRRR